jgi:peroxiredoxin
MQRGVLALAVAAAVAPEISAGQFNKKLNLGDPAPAFAGLAGVDGKAHGLADYRDREVLVLCITCNHCPVAIDYEDRMVSFAKKYAGPGGRVALVAVNVNNLEADRLPQMKARAREKGFPHDYLYDPSQKLARDLGASITPEFFVYNKDRKLVYTGAMDDRQQNPRVHYLEQAVEAVLKGEMPKTQETRPRGCSVQYEKARP